MKALLMAAALAVVPVSMVFADDDVLMGYKADPAAVEASRPNFGVNSDAPKPSQFGTPTAG